MRWRIAWTKPALRDMQQLDQATAKRIRNAMHRIASGQGGNIRRIRGSKNELRLRVGDWRVRFMFAPQEECIYVLRVLPRDKVYRN